MNKSAKRLVNRLTSQISQLSDIRTEIREFLVTEKYLEEKKKPSIEQRLKNDKKAA